MSDKKKKNKEVEEVVAKVEVEEVEVLKEKVAELENGWKRALADYDNLKKDLSREKQEMRKGTIEDSCLQLIPVLDNFDQAVRFQPEGLGDKEKNWLAGILHVRSQLEDVLRAFGAEPFCEEGDPFDPHMCDAVSERKEKNVKDQTIIEVAQRGWKISDKVLRPAKVIINNLEEK